MKTTGARMSSFAIFRQTAVALLLLGGITGGCAKSQPARAGSLNLPPDGADATYEVVATWPHDVGAFTQGLAFYQGNLLESTGLNGRSTLREVESKSGRVLKQVALARQFFGEGLTILGGKVYQVTWTQQKGFVYDADTFQKLNEFAYTGEGWGLTTDGAALILSDGTDRLRYLDPSTFAVVRSVSVQRNGVPVDKLNELEYVRGEVWANVWQSDRVVRIDPATGAVLGEIDFSGLLDPSERGRADVFNGIAYDPEADRLVVTGKFWPKLFEVRVKPRAPN